MDPNKEKVIKQGSLPGKDQQEDPRDNLQYTQLTKARLNEAIQVAKKSFFVDETICKAIDLKYNQSAMKELTELFAKVAEDGVSLVTIDTKTNNIAGVLFNKIHVKNRSSAEYYENYINRCKDPASKSFLSFMNGTDLLVDMFELCDENCYLEIMLLGVLPGYRGKSIAYNLCRSAESIARFLLSGYNIKRSINDCPLQLEPVPKFISAVFTSPVSQKLGKKLGMELAASAQLDKWTYKGQTFTERLGNNQSPIEYYYKIL